MTTHSTILRCYFAFLFTWKWKFIIIILCFWKFPFLANSQGQPLPENEVSRRKNDQENQFPDIKFCSELITGRNFLLRNGYQTKIDFQNWSQDETVRKLFLNKKLRPVINSEQNFLSGNWFSWSFFRLET